MGDPDEAPWELMLDDELERDLTKLVPWDEVMEQDLVDDDVADCGAAELAGKFTLLGPAL